MAIVYPTASSLFPSAQWWQDHANSVTVELAAVKDAGFPQRDLAAGEDLNLVTKPGTYRAPGLSDLLNLPPFETPQTGFSGFVTVANQPGGTWAAQEVIRYGVAPERWWRVSTNTTGAWGDWMRVPTIDDVAVEAANARLVEDWSRRRGGVKPTGGKGAVALRFDHGLANLKTVILPLLRARALPFGVAINPSNWAQQENTGCTQADVQGWVTNDRCEVWNHGGNHADATTPGTLRTQLVTSLATLRSQIPNAQIDGFMLPGVGGTQYLGFDAASPGVFTSTLAGRLLLKSHAVISGSMGSARRVIDGVVRQGQAHYTMDAQTASSIKNQIDLAISERTGLQLMLHPSNLNGSGMLTTAALTDVLDYIKTKRDAGDLVVFGPYDLLLADSSAVLTDDPRLSDARAPKNSPQPVNGTNLDTITTTGLYPISGYAAAASMTPPLPVVATGQLEVFTQNANVIQRWSTSANASGNQVWQREKNAGTWAAWRRIDNPANPWGKAGLSGTPATLDSLTSGFYEVWGPSEATGLGLPEGGGGALEVFAFGTAGVQRFSLYGSSHTWQRQRANGVWAPWHRTDATSNETAVPSYAGTRTRTWDQSHSLYNAESDALRRFRVAVTNARYRAARLRLVTVGDSKTAGAGVTASAYTYAYPSQLRDILGATDGILFAGNSYAPYRAITGFDLAAQYDKLHRASAGGASASITLDVARSSDGLTVYASADAGATLTATIDGGAPRTLTVPAGSGWTAFPITGLPNQAHTIVLTTADAVRLLGVEPTHSDNGFTVTNAGRSGSNAADWLLTGAADMWPSVTAVAKPDVIVVNIGTNTGSSTPADIVTVIGRAASLGVPVLIAAFGGIARSTLYDDKRKALYDAADQYDLPLVDFTAVIGDNATATAAGLMSDTLHENERGYALEAAAVARVASL